ncbi:MAG: hypothetical protein RIT19_718 [Verrucomicrobiota bacterium]|jgi:hypothetical protein
MNPIETRKRLLLAESDLLRVQLTEDVGMLLAAWRRAGIPTRPFGGASPMLDLLTVCLGAFGRLRDSGGRGTASRLGRLLRGAGLVSTLWLGWLRARRSAP